MPAAVAGKPAVFDFHAHVVHPDVYAVTANRCIVSGFGARPVPERPQPGDVRWRNFSRMTDPAVQIADMDARGIDKAVISSSTIAQGTFWADGPTAAQLERTANDGIAQWVALHPDRFTGAFALPLQDMNLALAELQRCVEQHGMRVVSLPAQVDGRYLGDPVFEPLWSAIATAKLTAFLHPDGIRDRAFLDYSLWNGIGQGIEETRLIASLIYEGLLERRPELKIVIAHGGGYLPAYIARLDRNATAHPVSVRNITKLPSDFLRQLYYDTVVYDPFVLEIIGRRVGYDRLIFGTDFPFGEDKPLAAFDGLPVDAATRDAILHGNAEKLLG